MKHIIVTRCNFKDDEGFEKYLPSIEKYFIPSINSQLNKNFELALIINPKHFNTIKNKINNKINILEFKDVKLDYRDYVIKNNVTIQTRHDCDDYMSPQYVEKIQQLYEKNKNKFDDFILNFHPYKHDVETGYDYYHSRDYSKVCSMFSTLIQNKVKNGIFDQMHDHLSRLTKNIIYVPASGYVKLVIHKNNKLSKISKEEKLVK